MENCKNLTINVYKTSKSKQYKTIVIENPLWFSVCSWTPIFWENDGVRIVVFLNQQTIELNFGETWLTVEVKSTSNP